MLTEATLPGHGRSDDEAAADRALWTLTVLWAPGQPALAGTVFPLGASPGLLGRGGALPEDSAPRILPCQQRPGRLVPCAPLEHRTVSRAQLRVQVVKDGVRMERIGRGRTWFDGEESDGGTFPVGTRVRVGDAALLLVQRRPGALVGPQPEHAFGGPDADGIVGEGPAICALRDRLRFLAPRDEHVLVTGATGTGKELVARALHRRSPRRRGSLVSRNAATLPEGLIDAELFGNIANYPNPGTPARPGLVGAADRGTLYLDEFAELPLDSQAHLLRVLDADGEYQRLGEARVRRSDLRLVAATNRPMSSLKHDVAARLPLHLNLPPLAERPEDLGLLLVHLLRDIVSGDPELRRSVLPGDTPRMGISLVEAALVSPPAGNVRGLRQLLWASLSEHPRGPLRRPSRMPPTASSAVQEPSAAALVTPRQVAPAPPAEDLEGRWRPYVGLAPEEMPPSAIQACLDAHNGVQRDTWQALGLNSRFVLRRLIQKHGLIVRRRLDG